MEKEKLNTGGPIKLAEKLILSKNSFSNDDLLLVFNSDVICQYPLEEMIKFHKSH